MPQHRHHPGFPSLNLVFRARLTNRSRISVQLFILYSIRVSIESFESNTNPAVERSRPRRGVASCERRNNRDMALKTLRRLFVSLAMLCIAEGAASAQQLPKMVHAGLRTLYLAPVFIGIDRGIFKANGVEVTYQELESG